MGVDPSEELYAGERPIPITDRGKPIRRIRLIFLAFNRADIWLVTTSGRS